MDAALVLLDTGQLSIYGLIKACVLHYFLPKGESISAELMQSCGPIS